MTDGKLYSTPTGAAGSWGNVVSAAAMSGTIGAAQIGAGAVGAAALADGVVTGSKFAPAIKTMQTLDALPPLPDSNYPPGTVIFIPSEGRLYRVQEAVDLVPIMTSNTAPSGVAVASSEYGASYAAWKAFDDDGATAWLSTLADGTPWTLEYQFAVARVITWYSISPRTSDVTQAPKTWTFEAWNGSAWVVLNTQTNVTGWVAGTKKTFDITNEASYSRYRLNISAASGSSYCAVAELEMSGWMMPTPTYLKDSDIASDAAIAQAKLALSIANTDVASGAAIAESKLALTYPTHARQHSVTAAADHTFPGGTTTFLRGDGTFAAPAGSSFPTGGIIMWSGAIVDIPAGWYLCDGNNGTPNLVDKFVVGAGGTYAKGATGGSGSHNHPAHAVTQPVYANEAAHTHPGSGYTGLAGAHEHTAPATGAADRSLAHSHSAGSLTAAAPAQTATAKGTSTAWNRPIEGHTHGVTGSTGGEGAPDHLHYGGNATTGGPGNHQHTASAVGAGTTHGHTRTTDAGVDAHIAANNMPPYLALAYIMKG